MLKSFRQTAPNNLLLLGDFINKKTKKISQLGGLPTNRADGVISN